MEKSPGGTEGELGDPLPELVSVDMSASIGVVGMQDGAGRAGLVDAVSSGCSVGRGRWLDLDCTRAIRSVVVMGACTCRTRAKMNGDGLEESRDRISAPELLELEASTVGLACARQGGGEEAATWRLGVGL